MQRKTRYIAIAVGLAVTAVTASAQIVFRGGAGVEPNPSYNGRYAFARLRYAGMGCMTGEGPGWRHDYPVAERHLMKIVTALTSARPRTDSSLVLNPDDPELMKYPIAYLSEPGCWNPSDTEVQGLRTYLKKGGFLIVDDTDSPGQSQRFWQHFEIQMDRVLPGARLVELDESSAIFQAFFGIKNLAEIRSRHGGEARYFGIFEDNDPKGRLMVIAHDNNDISEYWQWSKEGFLPIPLTNEAYKLGVNYIVYSLTH